ncbi:hypothetical protein, partial [Streptococcus pneumoniae]|uniref:hypothetical protein n=1 Tax=Streptococcus pneumoniae TaxID=1313 RepID=UPI001D11B6DE
KKHPLGEKRNHPGSKLRQGFWMVFRLGVNNWGFKIKKGIYRFTDMYITDFYRSCIDRISSLGSFPF